MRKESLDLSHQPLLSAKFRSLQVDLAEYTFANLYLFRQLHRYEVIFGEEIIIQGYTRDGFRYIMPTFIPTQQSIPFLKEQLEQADFLFPIPEIWMNVFYPILSQASFKEEDSDYLFQKSKLASYPGRHLSKKRNLVKQFCSQYVVETRPLTTENKNDALAILKRWQDEQQAGQEETDYTACQEAIEKLELLGLNGGLTYADQQPSGFFIGEPLSASCYTVHFTKALKQFKGIYQYLYQELANSLASPFSWINLEQDLGSSTIRQAKHSYQPDRLAHKMRVQLFPHEARKTASIKNIQF
ncbi:DUF2156 domain-containing protein [Candidatus Protochlamydia phocaeensis]|uniref:DUF2156 domain-containing protein n=1 Tax=Candidatus Protochlamydia phocaeensis TaxID=1414722 RepID=UPI0008380B87|nr:phosphatidylglycerol lysyltransferase domain-containing protein [Candidatus Protochlamydia phocaeensis]